MKTLERIAALVLVIFLISGALAMNTAAATRTSWADNVLMSAKNSTTAPLNGYRSSVVMESVFGSEIIRNEIGYVVFESTLKNVPSTAWDVSDDQNGSVMAWVEPYKKGLYELHIAAKGGVNGEKACEDLFCGYAFVEGIDFNEAFHTDETEDFSRMFYGCAQLKKLDVSEIRTDDGENFSEMFANCRSLTELDLSGFETGDAEDTSGMFNHCEALKKLDVSGFNLANVQDVSYMFYNCPAAKTVRIPRDGSWFRDVDCYDCFMDSGVKVNGNPWLELFAHAAASVTSGYVGQTVTFGTYEQDNISVNGKEDVEWIVLDEAEGKLLLLSKYALDSVPYHDNYLKVTWEICDLRDWLNDAFLRETFTKTEQKAIDETKVDNSAAQGNPGWKYQGSRDTVDKVFLLSYAEAENYFDTYSDRIAEPTRYAIKRGADTRTLNDGVTDAGWWWLRTPGKDSFQAAYVSFEGKIFSNGVGNGYLSVRPALWVDADAVR